MSPSDFTQEGAWGFASLSQAGTQGRGLRLEAEEGTGDSAWLHCGRAEWSPHSRLAKEDLGVLLPVSLGGLSRSLLSPMKTESEARRPREALCQVGSSGLQRGVPEAHTCGADRGAGGRGPAGPAAVLRSRPWARPLLLSRPSETQRLSQPLLPTETGPQGPCGSQAGTESWDPGGGALRGQKHSSTCASKLPELSARSGPRAVRPAPLSPQGLAPAFLHSFSLCSSARLPPPPAPVQVSAGARLRWAGGLS